MKADPDGRDSVKSYRGSEITVTFAARRCLHFAECLRGLPEVFDVQARPWVRPDNADAATVADVVQRCPSGALHYIRRDGIEEIPPAPTVVTTVENGPVLLHGDLEMSGLGGQWRETRVALCSCGGSARRPFCDNACRVTVVNSA